MKNPHYDELERIREQLRLRIDAAAKSVAEVLQVAADLVLAASTRKPDSEPRPEPVKVRPVPALMTPKQAAEYLGTKVQTLAIWRSTKRYQLPFVKVGSNVRYRKSDLDEFLQRRTECHGGSSR